MNMRARLLILLPLVAFAITLGIVIGERLSQEAMIVIIGVVAGIAASIPTSLLTVWLVVRRTAAIPTAGATAPTISPRTSPTEEPRIIVVQAPAGPSATTPPSASLYPEMAREPRRFNIIGDPDPLA